MKKAAFFILALPFILYGASALAAGESAAESLPPALAEVVEAARRDCASFENGKLTIEPGAVSRPDLDGDLRPDWALDARHMRCSTALSLFCGTGGCAAHFVVENAAAEFLTKKWEVKNFGALRVLLIQIHGANCGGTNLAPCVRALTWDAEAKKWRSPEPNEGGEN